MQTVSHASLHTPQPTPGLIDDHDALQEKKQTLSQLLVLQDVEGGKLLRVHALQAEDLDAGARKAALRHLRRAFHEEHHGRGADGFVDGGARLGG